MAVWRNTLKTISTTHVSKFMRGKYEESVPGIAMQPGLISRMSFLACVKLTLVSMGQWTVFINSGWNGANAVR